MDRRKVLTITIFFLLHLTVIHSQSDSQQMEGEVLFITSANVYVRFHQTDLISKGDTLFSGKGGGLSPCLIVTNKSSSSCVCISINTCDITKGDMMIHSTEAPIVEPLPIEQSKETLTSAKDTVHTADPALENASYGEEIIYKERIRGRISVANYSHFSDAYSNQHRQIIRGRLNAQNIGNSRLSFESYLNYRRTTHTGSESTGLTKSFLRVYNAALTYDIDENTSLLIGRKINQKISSLGAIDGLQVERYFGNFYTGVVAGFRPDISSYGFNSDLLQYGAYVGTSTQGKSIQVQSTLGLLEQRNAGSIDRRYLYLQHSSTFSKSFSIFSSAELDLFQSINNVNQTSLRLTNLYISLRHRFNRQISLMASYDSRKRIIYYERDRTQVEELLADDIARQGLRFRLNVRPAKYISTGISYSRRFQSDGSNKSNNINGFISHSRLPVIGGRLGVNFNWNKSNFSESKIASIRHSRTLIKKLLDGSFYYRRVQYDYPGRANQSAQNYFGSDLNLRINRQLQLSLLGELSTFESQIKYRFNIRLTKRFGK